MPTSYAQDPLRRDDAVASESGDKSPHSKVLRLVGAFPLPTSYAQDPLRRDDAVASESGDKSPHSKVLRLVGAFPLPTSYAQDPLRRDDAVASESGDKSPHSKVLRLVGAFPLPTSYAQDPLRRDDAVASESGDKSPHSRALRPRRLGNLGCAEGRAIRLAATVLPFLSGISRPGWPKSEESRQCFGMYLQPARSKSAINRRGRMKSAHRMSTRPSDRSSPAVTCTRRRFLAVVPAAGLSAALARGDDAPESIEQVTHLDLVELDGFRRSLVSYSDNQYLYESGRDEYYEIIARMHGAELSWPAVVQNVTRTLVTLRRCQFGRVRVVLNAVGGVGCRRGHATTPSAARYELHNRPTTLNVGGEVMESMARQLRKGDVLGLKGVIEQIDTRLYDGNSPDTLVMVTAIEVAPKLLPKEAAYTRS